MARAIRKEAPPGCDLPRFVWIWVVENVGVCTLVDSGDVCTRLRSERATHLQRSIVHSTGSRYHSGNKHTVQ